MLHITRYFKALSDNTRLRLMFILNRYELSVNELVSLLEMGQSRISRHLKILSEAGLVSARRDGLWAFYTATHEGEAAGFLKAVMPFGVEDNTVQADRIMAQRLIEERATKTRQFFNTIAEHWDTLNQEVMGAFDLPQAVAATMLDAVPQGGTIVDVGCGTGLVLERLAAHGHTLIGVDGSPRMLELARRRFAETERVSLRIGELEHLPLSDGEADGVCISLVLHHLDHPLAALTEIHRVLNAEGQLLVVDFDNHVQERMRQEYGDRWLGFDEDFLCSVLEEAAFDVRSVRHCIIEQELSLQFILACRR